MEVRCKKSAKGMKLAPSSSSCFITNLPTPILMEILCRLPLKTLAACKCVCKSWLNLSKDPYFTQLHRAKAPTEVCFQLDHEDDSIKLHMGNFHCLNNFDPLDVKFNTLFELPKFSVRSNNTLNYGAAMGDFKFSNSCNGLLCYYGGYGNRFAVIWNPCTREFITIPAPATWNCCRYGLGFSRKTNKYKLLRLVGQRTGESLGKNVVAEICTIEEGCSWNTLGPCPSYVSEAIDYFYRMDKDPTFLHGTLHWPSKNESDIDIPTFDFEDDRFGRVPLPPSSDKTNIWLCQVGELSGCLFITEYTSEGMNIWLMKEYGVQDSWTKMYSLPRIVKGEGLNQNCFLPVTCMDNSEILLVDAGFMSTLVFSYNPDQEGFRLIGPDLGPVRVIPYRPSLVPLKDSMLGYKVHVSALKHRKMSTTLDWWSLLTSPSWWTCLTEGGKRKGHVKATSQSSRKVVEPFKKQLERLQTKRKLERLQDEKMKVTKRKEETEKKRKVVEPLEKQIELLKRHNQRLEEKLQDEKAKVKQLEEKYNKASSSRRKSNK